MCRVCLLALKTMLHIKELRELIAFHTTFVLPLTLQ